MLGITIFILIGRVKMLKGFGSHVRDVGFNPEAWGATEGF